MEALADDEAAVRAAHERYSAALQSGDMDALAEQFTFPAAFKGFLEDIVIAQDKAALLSTYQALIAAAPKASRTQVTGIEVSFIRPGVYTLAMAYQQFDADDGLLHEGRAVYCMKRVDDGFKIFAVL